MKSIINTLSATGQHSRLAVRTHLKVGNACDKCENDYNYYKNTCNGKITQENRNACFKAADEYLNECREKYNCPMDEN